MALLTNVIRTMYFLIEINLAKGINRERYYLIFIWGIAMKPRKCVCRSQKCDLCFCKKLLIARAV